MKLASRNAPAPKNNEKKTNAGIARNIDTANNKIKTLNNFFFNFSAFLS